MRIMRTDSVVDAEGTIGLPSSLLTRSSKLRTRLCRRVKSLSMAMTAGLPCDSERDPKAGSLNQSLNSSAQEYQRYWI